MFATESPNCAGTLLQKFPICDARGISGEWADSRVRAYGWKRKLFERREMFFVWIQRWNNGFGKC